MDDIRDTLDDLHARVVDALGDVLDGVHATTDQQLADALVRAGDLARLIEALMVDAVGEVAERSRSIVRDERLTTRLGCHDVDELVQRLTRCAPQTAGRLRRAAAATGPAWDPIAGEERPARLPALRRAMLDGAAGVDGVLAIAGPLLAMGDRADRAHVLAADEVLAASARGEGPDGAPAACADLLRIQAQTWATMLDQDGALPREGESAFRRGVVLGRPRDGVVPIRGALMPEVAAQLQRIFDAICSPRAAAGGVRFAETGAGASTAHRTTPAADRGDDVRRGDDPGPVEDADRVELLDDRTRVQRQHDALATALFAAAAGKDLPTLGGAAPTLVVTARAEDLARGDGWAFLEGCDEPVSLRAATHAACGGVLQRLIHDDTGRLVRLGTDERLFNRHQRRAIAARDGRCVIPGCRVPAGWCEIHHVIEHAHGGATHTDNGVLLCWHHHRFIDTGPWRIRMNRGVPEVRAPLWFDRSGRWRQTTTSPTRLLNLVVRST